MRMHSFGWLVLIFIIVGTAVFGVGTAVFGAAQDDVLRVNTRLVQVDVIVRDRSGSVANLTRDDFTVLDNGKPQQIDVFRLGNHGQPKTMSRC